MLAASYWSHLVFLSSLWKWWCLQMPPPKVSFFGTFLKIESKIRKIIRFQNNTKFALVDEFLRNLRQMKDLGLIFQKKLKKIIFDHFCMFYSILNIGQIRIFESDEKYPICPLRELIFRKIELIFLKHFFTIFLTRRDLWIPSGRFFISALDLEI